MIKEIEAAAAFAGWQREKEKQDKRLFKKKQRITLTISKPF